MLLASIGFLGVLSGPAEASEPFDVWLEGVRVEAAGRGVSQKVIDTALGDIAPIEKVISLDRNQP